MLTCAVPCAWVQTVAPTGLAVSLEDAMAHCEITDSRQEAKVQAWLRAAIAHAENRLNRALYTQTWKLVLDDFANEMCLPMAAPLQSVSGITYYDTDGVQQTLATSVYRADTVSEPGRVVLKPSQSWPSVQSDRGQAVEITYVCGYTSEALLPDAIRHGVLLMVGAFSEHREAVTDVPTSELAVVNALLDPYAVYWRQPVR